jgi:hypothetical protein
MVSAQTQHPDVIALLEQAADGADLRGTFFLHDADEMLHATRQIEAAAQELDATLYVGFQDAARLDDEADVYRLLAREARVIAYGVGEPRTDIEELEWVSVPHDRRALDNQWFLVLVGEETLAFVGYETSPPRSYRKGPSQNEERTWEGFTSGDQRLIEHLVDRLERSRQLLGQPPGPAYLAVTDDGADPRYAAVRDAATAAARAEGASLVLYDRTTESYLTNPYPSGPWSDDEDALSPAYAMTPGRLDAIGRGYLAEQVRAAGEAEVRAVGHLAVDHGANALRDAVQRYRPAVVFLPAHLREPSLLDRVRGNTLSALRRAVDGTVRLVSADGTVIDLDG